MRVPQEHLDHWVFLIRTDWRFGLSIAGAILGLAAKIVDLIWFGGFKPSLLGWGSVLFAVGALIVVFLQVRKYRPEDADDRYVTKALAQFKSPTGTVKFVEIAPTDEEASAGYRQLDPGLSKGETALTSDAVNDWLSLGSGLPFRIGKSRAYGFMLEDANKRKLQQQFLYGQVYHRKEVTTNEIKYALSASILETEASHPIANRDKALSAFKVSYYDGIVTNNAFRSRIGERHRGTENDADIRKWQSLSDEFPATLNLASKRYVLEDIGTRAKAAGNVGITALVLSADGTPVFFQQSADSLQGGGQIVVCGSGSGDFADIRAVRQAEAYDLTAVVRYGMAREFWEEGSLTRLAHAKELLWEVFKNNMITGYFRWVSRSGKPEFVGVGRTSVAHTAIKPARDELIPIRDWKPPTICRVSDFQGLLDRLAEAKLSLSLSSAVAVWRLAQISKLAAEHPVRKRLAAKLELDNR